jgi:cell division septation protein DedD
MSSPVVRTSATFALEISNLIGPTKEQSGLCLDLIFICEVSTVKRGGLMENRKSPNARAIAKILGTVLGPILGIATVTALSGCNNSSSTNDGSAVLKGLKSETEIAQAAMDAEAAEEEISRARKPASQNKKSKSNSSKESIYLVQVGTFQEEENAIKILAKLKSAGLPAFQKKIERADGQTLFAVRIEPTPNRTEAEKFLASAKEATGQSPLILSVGQ